MKAVTEMDTYGPGLRRDLEKARRALPRALAWARMYEQAGRAAHPDYAASASLAVGIVEATITASLQLLSQLDDSAPCWEVILPTAAGEEGVSPIYGDGIHLYAYYPSGRRVRLRGRLSDLHDFAIVEIESEDGRSLGSGHIRAAAASR